MTLASYDAEKEKFTPDAIHEKDLQKLYPPNLFSNDRWIRKLQLSDDEFIYFYYLKDSVVYYNHSQNKRVTSPLPFQPHRAIGWESNLEIIDENTFAINCFNTGFFIFHLDRSKGTIICKPKKFLASHKINYLFLDKDKRLWVATSKGLLQQKLIRPVLQSWHYPQATYDNAFHGFQNAFRYKDKLYLTRFSRYNGLVIIDTTTMNVIKRIEFYGRDNMWNEIGSIQMYHTDTLWLATNAGILWFDTRSYRYGKVLYEKDYPQFPRIIAMLAPARSDGYAWFCFGLSGAVVRYHIASHSFTLFTSETKPALPFDMVKRIVYDAYGDVWLSGHSLARWNNKKQLFDMLITVYGGEHKYNDDILTMSADAQGSLWLHNADNSLLEYQIKNKKFIQYTIQDGLPSPVLNCLSPVIENILWIGSPNHLTKFNTKTKEMAVYDHTDGFPDEPPTGRHIYYDAETGQYYLFCRNHLVKFSNQPQGKYKTNDTLYIQELAINNSQTFFHPSSGMRLARNQNNLSLHYTIIDYENENYNFAYKINNAHTWTHVGEQRSINLSGLQEGKYLIQISVHGKSGKQLQQNFSFYIQPPFWKTIPFLIGLVGLLLASINYLYRFRIRQIRHKANLDKLLAQTEMKALHAQMNPHFISNSLNSIREMVLHNENKEASHFIAKFAHLIRVTLEQSTQSFISLKNAIDYLQRYREMEQVRNNLFTCHISADEELDLNETILPPMLIQPFIENAIWHGTSNSQSEVTVDVYFKKENKHLVCSIEDDGMGIAKSLKNKEGASDLKHSVGISNIKNRIQLLNERYNLQCSIVIEDKSLLTGNLETGTLVKLTIPIDLNV